MWIPLNFSVVNCVNGQRFQLPLNCMYVT